MSYRNRQGDGQFSPTPRSLINRVAPPEAPRIDLQLPQPVQLPLNYAVPDGAESLNLWRIDTLADATSFVARTVFTFVAPSTGITRIMYYSLYSSVGVGDKRVSFLPRKDGTRVYPYHGDPEENYALFSTGSTAESMGSNSLMYAPLTLLPGQTLTWSVIVRPQGDPPVPLPVGSLAGVRLVGYVDQDVERHQMFMRNA